MATLQATIEKISAEITDDGGNKANIHISWFVPPDKRSEIVFNDVHIDDPIMPQIVAASPTYGGDDLDFDWP